MSQPKYKKVLLKLSGEALLPPDAKYGIGVDAAKWVASEVSALCKLSTKVTIVIGGGNIFRGATAENSGMDRVRADTMGMLATVINGLALLEVFEKLSLPVQLFTARKYENVAEPYVPELARQYWQQGKVLILAGGTGNPYFSTDTAASLRAVELGAEVVLKGTKVEGVFDSDPVKNLKAKLFKTLTYDEVLTKNLKVMDSTAISMCRDNNIPIIVFDVFKKGNLLKIITEEQRGTLVYGYKNS